MIFAAALYNVDIINEAQPTISQYNTQKPADLNMSDTSSYHTLNW